MPDIKTAWKNRYIKKRPKAQKNTAKVAKILLEDPLLSDRELAKRAGIWKSTANEHRRVLGSTAKDGRIIGICDEDLEIVTLAQREIIERFQDKEKLDKIKTRDISTIAKESAARYTIFRWDITDENWWLKNSMRDMTLDELIELAESQEDREEA